MLEALGGHEVDELTCPPAFFERPYTWQPHEDPPQAK